jgi:hypothetical protein
VILVTKFSVPYKAENLPVFIYYVIELQMGVYPVAAVLQLDRTQNYTYHTKPHNAQTSSTQRYRNNKGHITHNEHNTKKVKLSP